MLTRPEHSTRRENRSKVPNSSGENSTPRRRSLSQEQPVKSTGLDSFPFPPEGQKETRRKQNQARELLHYKQT
jgi:hypothetical protein